jgi:hypothetical protein
VVVETTYHGIDRFAPLLLLCRPWSVIATDFVYVNTSKMGMLLCFNITVSVESRAKL